MSVQSFYFISLSSPTAYKTNCIGLRKLLSLELQTSTTQAASIPAYLVGARTLLPVVTTFYLLWYIVLITYISEVTLPCNHIQIRTQPGENILFLSLCIRVVLAKKSRRTLIRPLFKVQ